MSPTHWLRQLHVQALSLVDKGANKRQFQVFKSHTLPTGEKMMTSSNPPNPQQEPPVSPVLSPAAPQPMPDPLPSQQPSSGSTVLQEESNSAAWDQEPPPRHDADSDTAAADLLPPHDAVQDAAAAGTAPPQPDSEPTVHQQQQLEQAVQTFQEALRQADQTADTAQQHQQRVQARQQLLQQVQQLLRHTGAKQDPAPDKPTPVAAATQAAPPRAAEEAARQQDIAAVSKALQTTLHHGLQRQHQRLSRLSQHLLQLETRLRQLAKSAGASNAESVQAQQEAQAVTQQTPPVWEAITDGLGYVRKEVLRQRHRAADEQVTDTDRRATP